MASKSNDIYMMPILTLIGRGCLHKLGLHMKENGAKKALIVTDSYMCKSGVSAKVSDILSEQGIQSAIFDGVRANPTIKVVNGAINHFLDESCDSVVSIGGGSAHDTAKAVKMLVLKGGYSNTGHVVLAAVNTTAGTASEMTKYCIITDEDKHRKMAIISKTVIPDIAVDDPELMLGMPPSLTAATGMDALTHAIEAYTAVDHNELTDCTAIRATELVFKSLYNCFKNGQDIESREEMAFAQYMAGMAFSNAGLGLTHAMSHQLSGVYDLPHGVCNAVLLPYVMEFNLDVNFKRYAQLAIKVGIATQGLPDMVSANRLIKEIKSLISRLGIPKTLKELNVKTEDFGELSEMAMQDACFKANAKSATKDDLISIYKNAYFYK
jgi:alcohol dehydrogenase